MILRKYRITSEVGIHAQPATVLVNTAIKYNCDIYLCVGIKKVNMKSIMGVMSLAVSYGTIVEVLCDGIDESIASTVINDAIYEMKLGKEV